MGAAAAAAAWCVNVVVQVVVLTLLALLLLDDAWTATKLGKAKGPMTGQNSKVLRGL